MEYFSLPITGIFAGLLGLILMLLSMKVIGIRREHRVDLLHGEHPVLLRTMRAHGNFTEYTPIILLLMGIAELQEAKDGYIWLFGSCLLIGRIAHIYSMLVVEVREKNKHHNFRVLGMGLTFAALIGTSLAVLITSIGLLLTHMLD